MNFLIPDSLEKIQLHVETIPAYIRYECPHCGIETAIPYKEFIDEHGQPCDWNYDAVTCAECGKKYEIDGWEFS